MAIAPVATDGYVVIARRPNVAIAPVAGGDCIVAVSFYTVAVGDWKDVVINAPRKSSNSNKRTIVHATATQIYLG